MRRDTHVIHEYTVRDVSNECSDARVFQTLRGQYAVRTSVTSLPHDWCWHRSVVTPRCGSNSNNRDEISVDIAPR